MTSLSPMTPTEASIGEQFGSDATHVSNPQQAPLRRAHYVKVVDLATLNNLDVEKIKLETTKKRSESMENLEGEDTNASRDDESSSISPKYQKRVVPSIGGFNLCL
jgi:malate synthase